MGAPTKELHTAPPAKIGDFEIAKEVGRGSMGVVYEAIQVSLGRRVALKTFPTHGKSPVALERFKREAGAASKLVHPGIVPVYAVGEEKEFHYYAMQLVEGRTLRELIYTDKIPAGRAVTIAKRLAEALDYAHKQGVIHRDIKPSNIIVTEGDQPVITDFGLAKDKSLGAVTLAGVVIGTPTHMSPEQAAGSPKLDHRTDVYALGACLYEMLTYRLPFYGENLEELLQKVQDEDPPPPRSIDRRIPADLEAVALKALAKRPEERYLTAAELAEDLDRFARGERVRARRHTALRRLRRWIGKNQGTAAVLGGLLALMGGAGAFLGARAAARAAEVGRLGDDLERLMRERNPSAALAIAERIIALDPANMAAHERRAELAIARDRADAEGRRVRNREEADHHVAVARAAAERAETLSGREGQKAFDEALDAYGRALGLDPENGAARAGRGAIYLQRALEAERAGDQELAAIYLGFVREHNPSGLYDRQLKAEGAASIRTTVPGAAVTISRVVATEKGETALEKIAEGPAPLAREELPSGSYLVEVAAEGCVRALVPVAVERASRDDLEVRLLRPTEVPAGFVYIPAGPARIGGDPKAIRSLPRERRRVDAFFIAERETTVAEFAAFLNDLPQHDARALLPRGGPRQGYAALFWPDEQAKGRYTYPRTWPPDRPVTGVTYDAAVRYAAWRAAKEKRPLRLPTEYEWEKAARGADGRPYPWGEAPPEGRANVAQGAEGGQAKPTGSSEGDVSLYGVRDLIGNASEWTSSVLDTRLLHRIVRGGSYVPQADPPRAAARFPTEVQNPPEHTGIRLACDLGE